MPLSLDQGSCGYSRRGLDNYKEGAVMRFSRAWTLAGLAAVLVVAGCGGGDGDGGGGGGGLTRQGVIAYATVNGDAVTPTVLNFGGNGAGSASVTRNGLGDYTLTFNGTFPGVAGVDDVTLLAAISDTNGFHVASASSDQSSASSTQIVVRVFVWTTSVFPNTLADEDFSVAVAHDGALPTDAAGFAHVDAQAAGAAVFSFGGDQTTNVVAVRNAPGEYTVTFTGAYPGVSNLDDVTVLATIADTNNFHVASLSSDEGSANGTTIVAKVYVWTTGVSPNVQEDEDFSVMLLTQSGTGSPVVAYATVDAESGTPAVVDFGGTTTTNCVVTDLGVGTYDVTFTGTYPGVTSRNDVTVLVTMGDTDAFNVASASMDQGSANATTIVVRVFIWSTTVAPNPLQDRRFSVAVLN
jgi:hypothetical protein